mmetsp:Transcript_1839/g.5400  ORF Transcript_1839/g.5400 Transcript_1839/m.5400 type:complete len:419 (-) Transcript_1839:34-1290(-)
MTKDGWPVAQPRLRRRPSARTMTPWPSGKVYLSHCGLMFIRVVAFSSCSIWISLSKWPMLPTMALFFIFFMCSRVMMSLLPVVVMKTSASETRSSIVTTWYPSMHACSAQIGSISVTYVIAFCARIDAAEPLPTSPKPQMTTFLPESMTSVARMMPSGSECRQPYTLSNLDLVTQSLTLMAGKSSSPLSAIAMRRWTPVVVSSETPTMRWTMRVKRVGSLAIEFLIVASTHLNSALSVEAGSGSDLSLANCSSNFLPSWRRRVASPPSSTIWSMPSPSGQVSALSVHHQYSSSVSPFHAKMLAVPARTHADAAWSWVEKMLHEHQRTSAPSASSVSASTAVWMVMWSEPITRTPARGCAGPNSLRAAIRPGISCSAMSSSLRPKSASDMSATLKSPEASTFLGMVVGEWLSELDFRGS